MDATYSPKQVGHLIGRTVNTLQTWDRNGVLTSQRRPTNWRSYTPDQSRASRGLVAESAGKTVVYARVSRAGQTPELAHQVAALTPYGERRQVHAEAWVEALGSGLNSPRQPFTRLLQDLEVGRGRRLVVAHQDRLVRCGFAWFAACCQRHGTDLLIVTGERLSPEQELVHVLSARLSGLSSYRKGIRDAAVHQDPPPAQ